MHRNHQKQHKTWICLTFTTLIFIQTCNCATVGENILAQLTKFADDGLGVAAFQQYLDNDVTFVNTNLDAQTLAKQVAESMSARLNVRITALTDLNNEIQTMYTDASTLNPYTQCCNVPVYEKDPHLNTKVNFNEWCTVGQQLSTATEFLPSTILQHVKTQYNKALGIKYAYFASAQGVMFNYPALKVCQSDYDPRFRPWYVETSTPQSKDLVIVIDKSGSMTATYSGQTLLQIAQNAATTVMDTLNPNDRIGIVAFSTEAEVASSIACFQTQLASVTPQNRAYLKSFINGIVATGNTFYTKALTKAFQYFTNSSVIANDQRGRDQVILFLTDGSPTETTLSDIYNLIATENHKLGNNVTILTYGLGNNIGADVLDKMAKQVNTDPAYGNITQGTYTAVTDPSNLRSAMASYYEQFKHQDTAQVTITVPYLDSFGSGLVVSLCLPTNYQNQLKGVTCMDLSVEDMLSEITYFSEGESSYGFIIDSTGRVLTHPLVAFTSEVTNNPYFIYLNTLETATGIEEITNSMISGGNGTKVTSTQRIYARGNYKLEGTYRVNYGATYSWYPVSGTDFSVCLVITQGDQKASIQWTGSYPSTFLYQRLDLNTLTKCTHFKRDSIRDTDIVSFAARCFQDPYTYLNTNETQNTVDSYKNYFTGASQVNPGFKDGIRETVAATARFSDLMQSRLSYNLYSVWRFISTENGVHRIFPAVQIPHQYDATQRTWYVRAKANKGLMTISTPYEDLNGAGKVITLSSVIYEGNTLGQHTANDKTFGVMGMDFTVQYFYYLVTGTTSKCGSQNSANTCFVVDSAGFIIAHADWIGSSSSTIAENQHISQYEPSVASNLISSNIMQSDACVDIETLRKQTFWRLFSSRDIIYGNFELYPIKNTNAYLIVRTGSRWAGTTSCYSCPTSSSSFYQQFCSASTPCFCPCYQTTSVYQTCLGQFDFSGDTIRPCTPELSDIAFSSGYNQALQSCYNYYCTSSDKNTARNCSSVVSCAWCMYDQSGSSLTQAFCSSNSVCPSGRLSQSFVTDSPSEEEDTSYYWIVAPAWIAFLLAVVGIVFAAVYCKCCKCPCKKDNSTSDITRTTTPPPNRSQGSHPSASVSRRSQRPQPSVPLSDLSNMAPYIKDGQIINDGRKIPASVYAKLYPHG